jgi:hypothetical protein
MKVMFWDNAVFSINHSLVYFPNLHKSKFMTFLSYKMGCLCFVLFFQLVILERTGQREKLARLVLCVQPLKKKPSKSGGPVPSGMSGLYFSKTGYFSNFVNTTCS